MMSSPSGYMAGLETPMEIYAIADLHLGFSTGKWMDRFGDHWRGHHEKIAASWRERIRDEDLVLLPGDFSWAMKPAEVAIEFEWLAELPGRKVLTKGNHDYWWPKSQARLERMLPDGVFAIKKRAVVIDDVPIIGVRGGDFAPPRFGEDADKPPTEDEMATIEDILQREERELRMSISHLREIYDGERPPIAMFHYPPYPMQESESRFTRLLEKAGCRWCIFGHLHNPPEWAAVFQGEQRGIEYRLVACDALGFQPLHLGSATAC